MQIEKNALYGTQYHKGKLYLPGNGWKRRVTHGQTITETDKIEIER